MSVIGTGTQEDPYLVNNWTDFCSVKDEAGKYIMWEDLPSDQKIVEMNEEVPGGYTDQFTIRSAQVDFNGWNIHNLTINTNKPAISIAYNNNAVIKNAKITNINLSCTYPIGTNGYDSKTGTLQNCVINGMWSSNDTNYNDRVAPSSITFDRCSCKINVVTGSNGYNEWSSRFINSRVKSVITCLKNGTYVTLRNGGNIGHDSRFEFTVNAPNAINTDIAISVIGSRNSVYIVDSDVKSSFGTSDSSYTYTTSLVRSDNVNDIYNNNAFISVTDEQLKDADYLFSQGFPIATGVGE